MKKNMLKLVALGMSSLVLVGCGTKEVRISADKAKNNEIIITNKGTIQGVIKEKFDKKYYKEEDLKNFINSDLDEFNKENKTSIKLNSMSVRDKNVYVVLDYSSAEEFNAYNDYQLAVLDSNAAMNGSDIPNELNIYGKSKKESKKDAITKEMKAVVLKEKTDDKDENSIPSDNKVDLKVTVEGKIKYAKGASKDDSNTAKISSLKEPIAIVYK